MSGNFLHIGSLFLGLVFLFIGGEGLVKGASNFATRMGMRPITIGLTIVAFGTSMPEAIVSLVASIQSKSDIAYSNIVGSNIFNIGFILGLSALIRPLKVEQGSIRREIPFVIGSVILLLLLGWDGVLGRLDGLLLLAILILFIFICFKGAKIEEDAEPNEKRFGFLKTSGFIVAGLTGLVFGANLFVSGAVGIASWLGVSDLIIGLTIVSVGTSLPELVASGLSAYHGKDDLAIGNVMGSNIFNILFILGLCAVILPLSIPFDSIKRDVPILFGISLLCLPIMKSGFRITRLEGVLLLLCYLGYLGLILIPYFK